MDAPTGSILAYATAPGSVAADGTGRNGLYTQILLKHMQAPGVELGRVFRKVRVDVIAASNEQQVPWESSSLTGDFFFSPGRGIEVTGHTKEQNTASAVPVSPQKTNTVNIERDGNFEKLPSGIVYDNKTGLEWYAGPDKDTNWNEANSWVKSLKVPGDGFRLMGAGWRLPTYDELRSLYIKGAGAVNMTPLLQTRGSRVWSNEKKISGQLLWNGETRDTSLARAFVFSGGYDYWETMIRPNDYRAFAVRTRK